MTQSTEREGDWSWLPHDLVPSGDGSAHLAVHKDKDKTWMTERQSSLRVMDALLKAVDSRFLRTACPPHYGKWPVLVLKGPDGDLLVYHVNMHSSLLYRLATGAHVRILAADLSVCQWHCDLSDHHALYPSAIAGTTLPEHPDAIGTQA